MIENGRFLIGAARLLFGVKTYTETCLLFTVKTASSLESALYYLTGARNIPVLVKWVGFILLLARLKTRAFFLQLAVFFPKLAVFLNQLITLIFHLF